MLCLVQRETESMAIRPTSSKNVIDFFKDSKIGLESLDNMTHIYEQGD